MNFLLRFVPDQRLLYTYKCGNKDGVYETYKKVSRIAKPQVITLFFVDKDFSDILNENYDQYENIFVTDYYSIENYLVDEYMLQRVWNELFHFTNIVLPFAATLDKFQRELQEFYKNFLPIIAWIIHLRRRGYHPNINNLSLIQICSFTDDLILEMKDPSEITDIMERRCGVKTLPDFQMTISSISAELLSLEPKKYIRGKFELWFFVKFIEKLVHVLQESVKGSGGTLRVSTQIGEGNAVEILGPRANIPTSLDKFLRNNLRSVVS
jgi:hypothetical protein